MSNIKKSSSSTFFLISFLPALAYWFLEEHYPIKIAVVGGIVLALLELILEKIFTKHIHSLSQFNFILILFLGGISFLGNEGIWFKLQPMFTGIILGGYLAYKVMTSTGLLWKTMSSFNRPLPPFELWAPMEKRMAGLFFIYGIFMGVLAKWGNTEQWLFFKTIGFYSVFFFYSIAESINLRLKIKKMREREFKRNMFKRF